MVNICEIHMSLKAIETHIKKISQILRDDGIEVNSISCDLWSRYNDGMDVKVWDGVDYILRGVENDVFPAGIEDTLSALLHRKILFRKF